MNYCYASYQGQYCHILPLYAGTEEERGIAKWRKHISGEQRQQQDQQHEVDADESSSDAVDKLRSSSSSSSSDCYDLPCCMSFIRRWTFFKFVPFCPTFLVDVNHQHTTNDLEDNAGVANESAEVDTESRV